jgi:ribA/ribD-fused uncharacterized protein
VTASRLTSETNPFPRWASNFAPATVVEGGLTFPTVEHAYQAAKTLDPAERARVQAAYAPARAKGLGASLTLRPDWEQVKRDVMLGLLRQKFAASPARELLRELEGPIVEWNYWHDTIWGVCDGACESGPHPRQGTNWLGLLLELLRAELRLADGVSY